MKGVRLKVALADSIPHARPADPDAAPRLTAGQEPAASPPAPAPPAGRPRPGWRGRLSRWLRRPAEYARAYLTASVEHQLQLQAARTAEIGAAVGRLGGVDRQLEELLLETRSLALRLDEVERRQTADASALVRLQGAVSGVRAAADEQFRLGETQVKLQARLVAQADEVLGVLGPRFDELDIKVRPLVAFDEDSFAVRVADGYLLLPRWDPVFTLAVANASSGGLEPGVRRVLKALLQPGMKAADVGANVGLLTLAMATRVGPGGRVWAFEPEERVRVQLAKTLHLNGLAQVALSGSAVGVQAGRVTFHQSPIIGHSSLYALPEAEEADARRVEVEVVRLDEAIPGGVALDVVKIDVEGAELDVVRGMGRLFDGNPDMAVLAEFGPSHLQRVGIAPADWFAAFSAHGLQPRAIIEPAGVVGTVDAAALMSVESTNLVFVRPGGAADGRLPR